MVSKIASRGWGVLVGLRLGSPAICDGDSHAGGVPFAGVRSLIQTARRHRQRHAESPFALVADARSTSLSDSFGPSKPLSRGAFANSSTYFSKPMSRSLVVIICDLLRARQGSGHVSFGRAVWITSIWSERPRLFDLGSPLFQVRPSVEPRSLGSTLPEGFPGLPPF